jgi:DNA-binding response OmpR family regulator
VLQRLKSDAAWRDIPVIMISALDEMDSVVRCIEMGAEEYLPKPFNPVLLEARINASLEKKRLRDQEVEYLRNVALVTDAAAAVEAETFELDDLADVAARPDALGRLARVFQRMAREVYAREQRLKQQVRELRIELNEARQARQVAEITETDYFRQLQAEAQNLRDILEGPSE